VISRSQLSFAEAGKFVDPLSRLMVAADGQP
jgi:hypothetical protein